MTNLTEAVRWVHGRLFGFVQATQDLVIHGKKIYYSQDGTSPGVFDLSGSAGWVKVGSALGPSTFAAAALTNNVNLFTLAAGQVIQGIKIKHSVSFSGGAIASYTVSVGVSGNNAKYASAFDVFQAVAAGAYELSSNFGGEAGATQITATATSTGANLNAATAGSVDIWALLSVAT